MHETIQQTAKLIRLLAIASGKELSPEGIVIPSKSTSDEIKKIIEATRENPSEWISITLFSGDAEIFQAIIQALTPLTEEKTPSQVMPKFRKLSLSFRNTCITPGEVITLINHPNCPLGLSLFFGNCADNTAHTPNFYNRPLYDSPNAHDQFRRALADNSKVISFAIHISQESPVVGEGSISHNWIDLDNASLCRNANYLAFMLRLQTEKDETLKTNLWNFISTDQNRSELLEFCNNTNPEKIYDYFKGLFFLQHDDINNAFNCLFSSTSLPDYPCTRQGQEALAHFLYTLDHQANIKPSDAGENQDKSAGTKEEILIDYKTSLMLTNKVILWLLKDSDIRGPIYLPLVSSVIQKLTQGHDVPVELANNPVVILQKELNEFIQQILYPHVKIDEISEHDLRYFPCANYSWLNNDRVKQKLQETYGTNTVYVLEEVISRNPPTPGPSTFDPNKERKEEDPERVIMHARDSLSKLFAANAVVAPYKDKSVTAAADTTPTISYRRK